MAAAAGGGGVVVVLVVVVVVMVNSVEKVAIVQTYLRPLVANR